MPAESGYYRCNFEQKGEPYWTNRQKCRLFLFLTGDSVVTIPLVCMIKFSEM